MVLTRRRGARFAERSLLFVISFAVLSILSLLQLYLLASNNLVQRTRDSEIDLAPLLQSSTDRSTIDIKIQNYTEFCERCSWKEGHGGTCGKRVQFLIQKYNMSSVDAVNKVIDEEPSNCVLRTLMSHIIGDIVN